MREIPLLSFQRESPSLLSLSILNTSYYIIIIEVLCISLSERERETLRNRAWKAHGRGKGNKWQMLRDVVVFCALVPWTTTSLEDAMLLFRGISHRKTYEMLTELERAEAIENYDVGGQQMWGATELGVKSFIQGKLEAIPATLAQAVWTLSGVEKSEVKKNET